MAVAGGEEIIVRRKRIVFRVEQVLDVVATRKSVCPCEGKENNVRIKNVIVKVLAISFYFVSSSFGTNS